MQALLKQGGGGEHVEMKVKLPSGAEQSPIDPQSFFVTPPGKFTCCRQLVNRQLISGHFILSSQELLLGRELKRTSVYRENSENHLVN